MSRKPVIAIALAAASIAAGAQAAQAAQAAAPAGQQQLTARCAVWQRELGFARAVAGHDAVAFAAHIHADAVFGVGGRTTRGREAIVAGWRGIIDGSALQLRWYPDQVSVAGDGRTAYSSGPALYRDPQDGSYRLGRFGSVWQQGGDGEWRVIFDGGIESPKPVDKAAAKAFEAARRADCPQ